MTWPAKVLSPKDSPFDGEPLPDSVISRDGKVGRRSSLRSSVVIEPGRCHHQSALVTPIPSCFFVPVEGTSLGAEAVQLHALIGDVLLAVQASVQRAGCMLPSCPAPALVLRSPFAGPCETCSTRDPARRSARSPKYVASRFGTRFRASPANLPALRGTRRRKMAMAAEAGGADAVHVTALRAGRPLAARPSLVCTAPAYAVRFQTRPTRSVCSPSFRLFRVLARRVGVCSNWRRKAANW
ncbi:uncharacterized protein V1518DRAFT_204028 [Limtongia smithiae]|uniref:uncharacterized protein n=1 Tax=Limtongia smithiae TaxID=1125753 RepID=UPI0034CEE3C2